MENSFNRDRVRRPRIERELTPSEIRKLMAVDTEVWSILRKATIREPEPTVDDLFNRTYKTERERIRQNTQKYAKVTIADAMATEYGYDVSEEVRKADDAIPTDLNYGQLVELKIMKITDNGVVFDSGNYKNAFATRNNLSKYKKFREFAPLNALKARVVEIRPDVVMVDIFGPMIEQYILPIAKEPWVQYKLEGYQPITVKNLHLVRGGFLGHAVIPNISEWLGEEYTIDAFIPGSQIVQNTTEDFEQFEGHDVEAFIMSYGPKPGGNGMSLICSVKNLIKHRGNLKLMSVYGWWCDDGEQWKNFTTRTFPGVVTGIINSSQKCGVFVEVAELETTGIVNMSAERLAEFHPGDTITVALDGFDEKLVYNEIVGQMQHEVPFEVADGVLKETNVKPVFREA